MENYKGYREVILDDERMAEYYVGNYDNPDLIALENEYLLICDKADNIVDRVKFQDGEYERIGWQTIETTWGGEVKPRNQYQRLAIDLLNDNSIPVKILTGVYGCGKTFFMINAALRAIESGEKEKIIFVRNGLNPQGVPSIGALPGDALEKTIQWAMPIADHCGGEEGLRQLIERKQLEIVPLNFIRGRDFKNSIIFSDESENLTPKLIQLLIGRVGDNSELWIAGDYRQSDLGKKYPEGLSFMVERLKGDRLVGIVDMPVTERSPIAELSNLLDD